MLTIERFVVDNEDLADVYMVDSEHCSDSEKKAMYIKAAEAHRQLAELLRELAERRKADSCEGCVKEFGKGYLLVCTSCKRNYADLYEPEREIE